MTEQRTLILVKPDGVKQRHIGQVITRLEERGYEIEALKIITATKAQLRAHYADLVEKPFFPEIETYMQEGPIAAIIANGTNIVEVFHRMAGNTNPTHAELGTIRGDFGREWPDGLIRNVVHSSDSAESAENEIKVWFPEKSSAAHHE